MFGVLRESERIRPRRTDQNLNQTIQTKANKPNFKSEDLNKKELPNLSADAMLYESFTS